VPSSLENPGKRKRVTYLWINVVLAVIFIVILLVWLFGGRVLLYFSWVLLRVRVHKMRRHDAGFTADFRGEGGIA